LDTAQQAIDKKVIVVYSLQPDAIAIGRNSISKEESLNNIIDITNPRRDIEEAIAAGDLPRLLQMSGMLHGHFCPYSAIGVKASVRAVKKLGVKSTGMEETIAIVETNNCFSDGVQLITGCSFGNNALIYRDYGKTAFTLARRTGEAIRIAVKADNKFLEEREPEAMALFQKVVKEHAGTSEDDKRLRKMWRELSFKLLEVPDEELFDIRTMKIDVPAYAHMFASVKCSICGESVMEPRARLKDGKPVCVPCSGQEYYQLAGDGISIISPWLIEK
jgi:formylmethanofuran dehydrogenase subunit E